MISDTSSDRTADREENLLGQEELSCEMRSFLEQLPPELDLEWTKDKEFLYHFEAARFQCICQALKGLFPTSNRPHCILDFGYLHGLLPEFIHRSFPQASITVCDRPESPVFFNPAYRKMIAQRPYLKIEPYSLQEIDGLSGTFDLIILGEVIEHMNPTEVRDALLGLRRKISPSGGILITTPNGAGLHNLAQILFDKELVIYPPLFHATMGYPHIHLWSPRVLNMTLEHCGWRPGKPFYYDGREGELYARSNRTWGSIKYQVYIRIWRLMTWLRPAWKGFFVMMAIPEVEPEKP